MLVISFSFLFACRSDSAKVQLDEDTSIEAPEWWENEVDESDESSSSDSEEDTDKPEDGEFEDEKDSGLGDTQDCGDDFDPTASCEGDWTNTLCMHDGLYWWCEGGVWINEEDKG